MPHKRNPAVLENVLALLRSVRSIAPSIVESMISENERDWGCFLTQNGKQFLVHVILWPQH